MVDADFTIKDLSEKLKIHRNTLYRKLNGNVDFTANELKQMSELFNCSIDYLVGIKDEKN